MDTRTLRSQVLFAFGVLGIVVGSLDPLEGAPLILVGTVVVTLAAFLRPTRHRKLFSWGLPLTAIGVLTQYALSSVGGVGGSTGRPMWWLLVLLPYAIGWLITVVGVVLTIVESLRRPEASPR